MLRRLVVQLSDEQNDRIYNSSDLISLFGIDSFTLVPVPQPFTLIDVVISPNVVNATNLPEKVLVPLALITLR